MRLAEHEDWERVALYSFSKKIIWQRSKKEKDYKDIQAFHLFFPLYLTASPFISSSRLYQQMWYICSDSAQPLLTSAGLCPVVVDADW